MKTIASRNIVVYPKTTGAGTQYWDMDEDDQAYIYTWLYRLMSDMQELATYDAELQREWFKRRPGLYPRGKQGPNSHASILGGICSARLRDHKKNLSTPQLDVVERMMDIVAQQYSDEELAPTSIIFEKRIFTIGD